mgnify:CR=1 FL=1
MDKILASCGLDCATCCAYICFKNDDQKLRIKSAAEWSERYHADVKPEDVNCSGCLETGPKIKHCNECAMRLCTIKKNIKHCGLCGDYPCPDLNKFFEMVPGAKKTLDDLRAEKK